jgi:hypothetical protein
MDKYVGKWIERWEDRYRNTWQIDGKLVNKWIRIGGLCRLVDVYVSRQDGWT